MAAAVAGPEIERLIQLLARLPGLGPRSARRAALHLIKKREALMTPLTSALQVAIDKIQVCKTCNGNGQNPACTQCRGEGTMTCNRCRGAGKIRNTICTDCNGEGVVLCSNCKGAGRVARR